MVDQHAARHVDAVVAVGVDGTGVGVVTHGQGDGVTLAGIATHRTGNGDGLGGFLGVDHVVTGDGVDGDGGRGKRILERVVYACLCFASLVFNTCLDRDGTIH